MISYYSTVVTMSLSCIPFLGRIAVLRRCGLLLQEYSVLWWSVCHDSEPCKNGWSDRDPCRLVCGLGWAQKHALDGVAHWRHLGNMIEPSMCGGDADFV